MNGRRHAILLASGVALVAVAVAVTQAITLHWYTIDGGGTVLSTGGAYELNGTIGQHDPGEMAGGNFSLTGGFWYGCVPADCDCDGGVDLDDFARFQECFRGPGGGLPETDCVCFDEDASGDVDAKDFAALQTAFTG